MKEIEKDDIDEPRLFEENGVAARVAVLIAPLLKPLGFRLVRIKILSLNGLTLQIMAERTNGIMTIEDCEIVSRTIAPLLDIENVIERKYHLEISSPGIDRPLVRKSDFFHWQGHLVKIETSTAIDGRKKFRGKLVNVAQNGLTLNLDKTADGKEMHVFISFSNITNAHLVLTNELIRDTLKKNYNN
ncbi:MULTISPECIES: ribosome maturation factor RimP [unclassified Bartonella]|uniref:ribosome maturation factor RimP n=1 Tax=unclassified Bartonella TaxID=2645622 RepID=UPI000998FA73|nr:MULTISPECIES: ribosome maturation factor RimP [unclassified Bartonella]AQX27453.1 ribosome maturation factor RimP [Bartonella sp. JB15]AQX28734.1 ribosome maturation factor RimP [Bartonella sp. JB63]